MRKIAYIAGIFIAAILIVIFLTHGKEVDTDVTKEKTMVGLILNGAKDDHSWSQSHYEGIMRAAEDLNLEVLCRESVPATEECRDVMEEFAEAGCRIIITDSYNYGEFELAEAQEHPEIFYYHATGVEESDNLATYFGRIYQMRYLTGIVAGLQTETNEIGYVAAFQISEVNRGLNAFTLGVRSVNPDAVVHVGWSNSWTDYDATKAAAESLIDSTDIDVLAMHTDSLAALDAAAEHGIWSIGYNMDNSELYPDTFLTAPVWDWENFYEPQILACLQGKFQSKHYWEDAVSGVINIAPLTENVKSGTDAVVQEAFDKLKSGTFDVFYGEIRDADGNVRVNEGESMTDEAMLNEFDWYVEGVEIDQ